MKNKVPFFYAEPFKWLSGINDEKYFIPGEYEYKFNCLSNIKAEIQLN